MKGRRARPHTTMRVKTAKRPGRMLRPGHGSQGQRAGDRRLLSRDDDHIGPDQRRPRFAFDLGMGHVLME